MAKRSRNAKPDDWTSQSVAPPQEASEVQFSEEEWHQPAADRRGHSSRLECRVPPAVKRVIDSLIASQAFPYETADDLVRHAVIRHIYALHSYNRAVPRTLFTVAWAVMRMAQDHQNLRQMQDAIREALAVLDDLAAEGDYAEIARKIAFVDTALATMPDTSPWKRRFVRAWRSRSQRYRELSQEDSYPLCPSTLPEPELEQDVLL